MPMLARIRCGKIHADDCFCCNDGFSKLGSRGKRMIRKQNRILEKRDTHRQILEETHD